MLKMIHFSESRKSKEIKNFVLKDNKIYLSFTFPTATLLVRSRGVVSMV